MHVGVGSENPVKVAATKRALGDLATTVVPVAVDSGVPEQPRGQAETVTGAQQRATRALSATDADLGVGIEGGVARFEATEGLFLIMWAAVTDGSEVGHGAGPSLRLPADIAARVEAGEELGPVMDDRLETVGVARNQGAAGVLTDGAMDRESALAHAVAGAAGPFRTPHY